MRVRAEEAERTLVAGRWSRAGGTVVRRYGGTEEEPVDRPALPWAGRGEEGRPSPASPVPVVHRSAPLLRRPGATAASTQKRTHTSSYVTGKWAATVRSPQLRSSDISAGASSSLLALASSILASKLDAPKLVAAASIVTRQEIYESYASFVRLRQIMVGKDGELADIDDESLARVKLISSKKRQLEETADQVGLSIIPFHS
jgi:hypothetical protein